MDDFYDPISNQTTTVTNGWVAATLEAASSPNVILALVLGPFIIAALTRYVSGRQVQNAGGDKSAWKVPYWIPFVGHGFSFIWNPMKLLKEAKGKSPYAMFALHMGGTTHNIVTEPDLVRNVMAQRESTISFHLVVWDILEKFFGFPRSSKEKYFAHWDELNSIFKYMLREPGLGQMLNATIRNMERGIPSMISFVDTDIDLQPWEKYADSTYISDTETSVDLMKLMRDMMGHASIPAMHGKAFLEKYPNVLHDIYDLDQGMLYLIMGLPAWTPWSPVIKAHNARRRLWEALDAQQVAMDLEANGEDPGNGWSDMEDVSLFTRKRNEIYRKHGFVIRERGELPVTWALIVNSSLIVYWQILHILNTPSLLAQIRSELEPHVKIHKPFTIGRISEAPRISIDPEGLTTCHLLKATYLEALRISAQPWSVRIVSTSVTVYGDSPTSNFHLKKGEYVTMPHDLHMTDPAYFPDPTKFDAERFLVRDEDGKITGTDMKTIRPYGGGPSLCKGRVLAERECLALVAGVLAYWDFAPDEESGFRIPGFVKTAAIARPDGDTRVRVKRRRFEWDE